MRRLPDHVLLLFDGTCDVCTRIARYLRVLDRAGRLTLQPNQAPGLIERVGLTRADVDASAWAVTPDGRRYGGAAAINLALCVMWRSRLLWRFYRLPPVRRVEDALYEFIAANRHHIPGDRPYCEQHPEACGRAS